MIADVLDGAAQLTARLPDFDPFATVGCPGVDGRSATVFTVPLTRISMGPSSMVHVPSEVASRRTELFAMLHPAAAESSEVDCVRSTDPRFASTTTKYVVLALSRAPAGAVNVLLPLITDVGLVSVATRPVPAGTPDRSTLTVTLLARAAKLTSTLVRV